MKQVDILEVGIKPDGRLYVRPSNEDFRCIYRAAMSVKWDEKEKILIFSAAKDFSVYGCFQQIVEVIKSEYGCTLIVSSQTKFSNLPADFSDQLKMLD